MKHLYHTQPKRPAGRLVAVILETESRFGQILSKHTKSVDTNVLVTNSDIINPGNTPLARRANSVNKVYHVDEDGIEDQPDCLDDKTKRTLMESLFSIPENMRAHHIKKHIKSIGIDLFDQPDCDIMNNVVILQRRSATGYPICDGQDQVDFQTGVGKRISTFLQPNDKELFVTVALVPPFVSAHERMLHKRMVESHIDKHVKSHGWAKRFSWSKGFVWDKITANPT